MDVIDKKPPNKVVFSTRREYACYVSVLTPFADEQWNTGVQSTILPFLWIFWMRLMIEEKGVNYRSHVFLMHKHAGRRDCILYCTWSGYKLANQMVSSAVETIFLTFSNTIYIVSTRMASEFWMKGQSLRPILKERLLWFWHSVSGCLFWSIHIDDIIICMAPCELKLHVDLNYHTMQYTQS